MAKAAHSLKAARRWAVSGTPIQNSLRAWGLGAWLACIGAGVQGLAASVFLQRHISSIPDLPAIPPAPHPTLPTHTPLPCRMPEPLPVAAPPSLTAPLTPPHPPPPLPLPAEDLHGICRFLHLDTLDDRSLFLRTIERPIKQRDPLGLKRLQVGGAGWCRCS